MRMWHVLVGLTLLGCGASRYPVALVADQDSISLTEASTTAELLAWGSSRAEGEQVVPPDTLVFCQPVSFGYQAKLRWADRELPLSAIVASTVSWDVQMMNSAAALRWEEDGLGVHREGQISVAVINADENLRAAPVADFLDAVESACERYSRVLVALR